MLYYISLNTMLGTIYIGADDRAIVKVSVREDEWKLFVQKKNPVLFNHPTPLLVRATQQFKEYFESKRTTFDLPLFQTGTPFQKNVWEQLQKIPYGETMSYSDVAERINRPKSVRAIGQANRVNPLPIIVPCHRVIGKNKNLTGYAGNKIDLKQKLLTLEAMNRPN